MRRALLIAALLLALAGCHDDDGGQGRGEGGGAPAAGAEADANGGETGNERVNGGGDGKRGGQQGSGGVLSQVPAEKAVRIVIDGVLTSGEPLLACDLYVTPRYVRTAYGGRDGCTRAQGEKATADRLAIELVRVNGPEAAVVAVPSGGASDGERLEIALVRRGGAWRVDRIRADVPVGP